MANRIKKVTQVFTIPSGTGAGQNDQKITLENAFPKVTGFRINEITAGGIAYWKAGLKDQNDVIEDKEVSDVYFYDPQKPWTPQEWEHKGQQITIMIDLPSALSSDLTFEVSFRCEK